MAMQLTEQQVLAMAPDSASAAAGRKQTSKSLWKELGHSPDAVWGLCQGSALYQVRIDRLNMGTSCSCPSRKFPCKHALGLLLLIASDPAAVPEDEPPDWVADWIEKRRARQTAKAEPEPESAPRKPVDEKAQKRRVSARDDKVRAGIERLDVWIKDLVRGGLAGLERRPRSFWDDQAKRLVDAQAPGLARHVGRLGDIPGRTPDWPAQMLRDLGRLKLLMHAYERHTQFPLPLQQDVRQLVGWNVSSQELEDHGESVEDEWVIFGQSVDEEERLRSQRNWAIGLNTLRSALILQFAPGTQPFPEPILPGTVQKGELRFYPGAAKLRAKFQHRLGEVRELDTRLAGDDDIESLLQRRSEQLALQPWLTVFGCVLRDVTVTRDQDRWFVRDSSGAALPLDSREHWKLLAITGARPFDIMGELAGNSLRPLAIWHENHYRPLSN